MTYAAITGWGKCMPPAVLSNADLASLMETDDAWITSRTGIRERRVSHVTGIELSHVAAARALACAGLDAKDVDLILYGSCSNDETVPNSASGVQYRLGALNAASMDINTACTSFMYALSTATAMIRTGVVRNAVVIGVELISQFMDWSNRGVAVLFGDGAAAVVLAGAQREQRPAGPRLIGSRSLFFPDTEEIMGWRIDDGGFNVVLTAGIPDLIRAHLRGAVDSFLAEHGLSRRNVEHWVAHTGGPKVLRAIEDALELGHGGLARSWRSLAAIGNLSSASVLFVAADLLDSGEAREGDHGVLLSLGPGFCGELVLVRW